MHLEISFAVPQHFDVHIEIAFIAFHPAVPPLDHGNTKFGIGHRPFTLGCCPIAVRGIDMTRFGLARPREDSLLDELQKQIHLSQVACGRFSNALWLLETFMLPSNAAF